MKRIAYILLACLVLACVFSASAQVTTSPSVTGVGQPGNALNRINANSSALPAGPAGTLLQVGNADNTNSRILLDAFGTGIPVLAGRRSDGTNGTKAASTGTTPLVAIQAFGYGTTAYSATSRANISAFATQTWTDANQGTSWLISTTPNNSTTLTTAATFGQDQSLTVVGTIAATFASNTGVQSGYLCYNTVGGVITYDGTNTCLVSREEYKDIAGPITGALAEVKKLKPFWGSYKAGTPMTDHRVQPFFGAHQLEAVDPRLVTYTEGGELHGVRYQNITAVLAAAIQEQQVQIDSLKREVRRLKLRGK